PTREQQFENLLNDLLDKVEADMKIYRKERVVLTQMISPANLTDPAYVEENYKMMQQSIPDLEQRMDTVMQRFNDAEKDMNGILLGSSADSRQRIMAQWRALKNTQVKTYSGYFASDKELFAAYRHLMEFYLAKREVFFVDLDKGEIIFKNPEDAALE